MGLTTGVSKGGDIGDRKRNLATLDPLVAGPVAWFRMGTGPIRGSTVPLCEGKVHPVCVKHL